MDGKVYLTASEATKQIFVTDDPASGNWTVAGELGTSYDDPDLFLDDDGRLYMYFGLDNANPLHVAELDRKTFQKIRQVDAPACCSKDTRGWQVPGDHNERLTDPVYIEGSWMNKHNGTYYLQFAAPGTQFKAYCDGVLVSKNPMGPFTYAPYSPFSFKPTGFISGAGHSSTFEGVDGQYWHISTMAISVRQIFERRLGLFPTYFTKDGELVTDTYLGDYPHYVDGDRGLAGWMLLSRKKSVSASSSLEKHEPELAVDEEVRTWWSAKTGDPGEWFQVDLGGDKTIEAIQINFADEGSTRESLDKAAYRYVLEVSGDSKGWSAVVDHEKDGRDSPHDYEVLPHSTKARYVRIRNVYSPNGAKFSISDLRVFGLGSVALPAKVSRVAAIRDAADERHATVNWNAAKGAEFYIVRLGSNSSELTQNYQVYDGETNLKVPSLNSGVPYFVSVDAVNESGVTRGGTPVSLK